LHGGGVGVGGGVTGGAASIPQSGHQGSQGLK